MAYDKKNIPILEGTERQIALRRSILEKKFSLSQFGANRVQSEIAIPKENHYVKDLNSATNALGWDMDINYSTGLIASASFGRSARASTVFIEHGREHSKIRIIGQSTEFATLDFFDFEKELKKMGDYRFKNETYIQPIRTSFEGSFKGRCLAQHGYRGRDGGLYDLFQTLL